MFTNRSFLGARGSLFTRIFIKQDFSFALTKNNFDVLFQKKYPPRSNGLFLTRIKIFLSVVSFIFFLFFFLL